jgi:alpha-L-fucosidase
MTASDQAPAEPASWFDDARFGMFVHWSHSSQQGIELSWPMVRGNPVLPRCTTVSVDQYHASAPTFDPRAWDAPALARRARRLGMTYAVITAKHHDGYAMFDTHVSDFSVVRSPYGRDIVGEFVEALRAEGLRVGLYFSLIDWRHPDYPAATDADRPYGPATWRRPSPEQWARFIDFMFAQVRELLTQYGPIDMLWFDGGWERSAEQWHARELHDMIRQLQPHILINDRLPGFGDFATPEQFVPAQPPAGRWETCLTINESWGYNTVDTDFKSARSLIHTLAEVAGRGGNLLLNVGPRGDGSLPPELEERLDELARWMALHAPAIVGTGPALAPWQFYGPATSRGGRLYLHLLMRPYETVTVRGVRIRNVRRALVLSSGRELPFRTRCSVIDQLLNPDPLGELTIELAEADLDPSATVIAVDFDPPAFS